MIPFPELTVCNILCRRAAFAICLLLGDLSSTIIPQTVLALRGSDGVAKEGAMVGQRIRARMRPLIFVVIYSNLGTFFLKCCRPCNEREATKVGQSVVNSTKKWKSQF